MLPAGMQKYKSNYDHMTAVAKSGVLQRNDVAIRHTVKFLPVSNTIRGDTPAQSTLVFQKSTDYLVLRMSCVVVCQPLMDVTKLHWVVVQNSNGFSKHDHQWCF